jgi:hypothetical protein
MERINQIAISIPARALAEQAAVRERIDPSNPRFIRSEFLGHYARAQKLFSMSSQVGAAASPDDYRRRATELEAAAKMLQADIHSVVFLLNSLERNCFVAALDKLATVSHGDRQRASARFGSSPDARDGDMSGLRFIQACVQIENTIIECRR